MFVGDLQIQINRTVNHFRLLFSLIQGSLIQNTNSISHSNWQLTTEMSSKTLP